MDTVKDLGVEPNLTKCAVCHNLFTIPKILLCGHHLCRDCLVRWLQSNPQAACPFCRSLIMDPIKQERWSAEEVADGLPTDMAMTAMVEAETLLSKQQVCCICDDVVAVALCLQCEEMLCQNCRNVHKKQKATKHHDVENLSTLTTIRLAAHHPVTCPDHKEEVSKMYCPNHCTSVCLQCASTTHWDCTKLYSLQSQVDELTAELVQLRDILAEGADKADAWLCLVDIQVAELQKESQAALDEMKNVFDGLKTAVETRFLQVRDIILQFMSDFTAKAANIKDCIIRKRSKIAAHKNLTELYETFTEHMYFKDMVSVVKGRLPDLDTVESLPEILQLNQKLIQTIDLQAVADAERIISGLGAVTITAAETEVRMTQFNPMRATLSRGVIIETRTQEDRVTPDITSMVTGPSCEVLFMSDFNNNSIKVFSLKSNSLISTLALDVKPWAIALVRDNLLAVTSEADNVITLIDINITDMGKSVVRTVNTQRKYRGICVFLNDSDDVKLIVSCGHDETRPATVDMITMEGNWMRTIVNSKSLPELHMPWHLHADTRRDVLYIPDCDTSCVFCVQLSTGRVLPQLQHPQLLLPLQVCTDSDGNLYVACKWTKCVLVRSKRGIWRVLVRRSLWDIVQQREQEALTQAVCVTNSNMIVSFGQHIGVKLYKMT